jgi:hypothetical protein
MLRGVWAGCVHNPGTLLAEVRFCSLFFGGRGRGPLGGGPGHGGNLVDLMEGRKVVVLFNVMMRGLAYIIAAW